MQRISDPYRRVWTRSGEEPEPGPADLAEARRELRRFNRLRRRVLWGRREKGHRRFTIVLRTVRRLGRLKRTWRAFRAKAASVAAESGVSRLRQLLLLLRFGRRHGVSPSDFYLLHLYRPERRAHVDLYIDDRLHGDVHAGVFGWKWSPTKLEVAERGSAAGLPVIPTLASCPPHGTPVVLEPDSALWEGDLFTKHDRGGLGSSQRKWSWNGSGGYSSEDVTVASRDELLDHLCANPRTFPRMYAKGPQTEIVQPCLTMHRSLTGLTSGGLNTIRVHSIGATRTRPIRLIAPAIKLVAGGGIVDNLAAGGNLVAGVDLETGAIGQAFIKGEGGMFEPIDRHPDTGQKIEGVRLPHWDELLDACVAAHELFSESPSIGWDMAVTDEGPVIVEGNLKFGFPQGVSDFFLGLTPYPRWTADWLEEWLESHDD